MGYGNNRGGYGNSRGGGYQNNRGGGGYRGGNNRGGSRGGNNGGNRGGDDFKYVRSSFFSKTLILDGEDGKREPQDIEPGVTEEIAVTLSPQKTQDLMKKMEDAINSPDGDGGVRMTLYCQHKINPQDNSEFDGASILVVGKFPPKNQNGYQGGNRGGNGRRDYPDRGNARAGSGQNRDQSQRTNTASGRGQDQQSANGASHSDDGYQGGSEDNNYSENAGW